MLKRIIAWLKNWIMEGNWPAMVKSQVMTVTKYRGPKKRRYRKLRSDIGRKVSYCIPFDG
jgi:hypothetical protein